MKEFTSNPIAGKVYTTPSHNSYQPRYRQTCRVQGALYVIKWSQMETGYGIGTQVPVPRLPKHYTGTYGTGYRYLPAHHPTRDPPE
jgi:hypothetical protein